MTRGWIYILSNTSMPGLVKIGSAVDVKERVNELNISTSAPLPFTIEATYETADLLGTEKRIHKILDSFRINQKREFFQLSVLAAKQIVGSELSGHNLFRLGLGDVTRVSEHGGLGASLKRIRKQRGLTQKVLAQKSRVSADSHITRYEAGQDLMVSTLSRMLDAMGLEIAFVPILKQGDPTPASSPNPISRG